MGFSYCSRSLLLFPRDNVLELMRWVCPREFQTLEKQTKKVGMVWWEEFWS